MQTFARFALTAFTVASIAACSAAPPGEPGAYTSGAVEAPASASSSGLFVSLGTGPAKRALVGLANAATTDCADGSKQNLCPATLAFDDAIPADVQKTITDAVFKGRAVVGGMLSMGDDEPVLRISSAYIAVTGNVVPKVDGIYLIEEGGRSNPTHIATANAVGPDASEPAAGQIYPNVTLTAEQEQIVDRGFSSYTIAMAGAFSRGLTGRYLYVDEYYIQVAGQPRD